MFSQAIVLATLAVSLVSSAAVQPRQWPGKCTIGIEHWNNFIPGGSPATGAGSATLVSNSYAYIVGSDNVQTNVDVYQGDNNQMTADGNYGGTSGGTWHVSAVNPGVNNVAACTISFVGRSDKGDETFDSSTVPTEVCDTYKSTRPFGASSGCRCRFDCQ